MKFRILATSILLLTSTICQADDLLEVYKLAKQNDPTYQAAVAEYQAAIEASPKAFSAVLPQINLSGTHTETYNETRNGIDLNDYSTDSYSLTLSQTIFNKARFDAIAQADALVAQAEAVYGNAQDDLVLRVAQNYFDVLSESANLVFAKAEKKAISQQLDQAKQRFKVGLTAITDVHEAQARYDQSVAQQLEAERLYNISLESLRELTGQMPANLAKVKEQHEMIAPDPADIESWVKTALDKNLLLLSAQKAVEAAMEGRDLASAGHYPTLDLQADYTNYDSETGITGTPLKTDGTSVSLVLNVPIYSGGGTSASAREAAANLQRSKELYEQQRRATIRQVRNSYLTVLSAISQAQALKQALRSSQIALEATQAGFEVGTRTTVDVLNSQRDLYSAERDYIRARHGYILSTIVLKQAAGTLTEDDVRLINAWLE